PERRVRQRHVADRTTQLAQRIDRADAACSHAVIEIRVEILRRDADREGIIRVMARRVGGLHRGVEVIRPGDHVEYRSGIPDTAREYADLVERRCERDEAVATDAAVRRADTDDAAERGGLAHGAARVGAQRNRYR